MFDYGPAIHWHGTWHTPSVGRAQVQRPVIKRGNIKSLMNSGKKISVNPLEIWGKSSVNDGLSRFFQDVPFKTGYRQPSLAFTSKKTHPMCNQSPVPCWLSFPSPWPPITSISYIYFLAFGSTRSPGEQLLRTQLQLLVEIKKSNGMCPFLD